MSTSIIVPGTRLANRYRLEDRVSESGGSTLWKAIDEILARPVAIRTFEPDFAQVGEVVTAARAASRLTDPRLTQVFDADDSGERAYVVSEWVGGDNLEDLLQNGPMEPERAAALIGEVAEAIAAAHEAGLAHLRLSPANVIWTTGGTIKVTGLAVDAALARVNARPAEQQGGPAGEPDPATVDVRGLGRLLYAAITAHWPDDDEAVTSPGAAAAPAGTAPPPPARPRVRLPTAPRTGGGVICAPSQVLAGISHTLDKVVCRALGIHLRGEPAFATPTQLAAALDHVPRTPLPLFMGMRQAPPPQAPTRQTRPATVPTQQAGGRTSPATPPPPSPRQSPPPGRAKNRTPPYVPSVPSGASAAQATAPSAPGARTPSTSSGSAAPKTAAAQEPAWWQPGGGSPGAPAPRHRADGQINKPLVSLAALLAVIVVAIGGWKLSHLGGGGGNGGAKATPPASSPSGKQSTTLRINDASGFDPKPGDGDEKSDRAPLAIDSKPGTVWTTDGYNSARFGQLKSGVGLLLDMGKDVSISDVKVTLPAPTGSALQLRIGDEPTLSALDTVAKDTDTSGTITFHLSSVQRGRYVLLWFTKLASDDGGRFRGKISDVVVHGPAS